MSSSSAPPSTKPKQRRPPRTRAAAKAARKPATVSEKKQDQKEETKETKETWMSIKTLQDLLKICVGQRRPFFVDVRSVDWFGPETKCVGLLELNGLDETDKKKRYEVHGSLKLFELPQLKRKTERVGAKSSYVDEDDLVKQQFSLRIIPHEQCLNLDPTQFY